MSQTEMYLVDRDGDVVPLATLKNAHGGAIAIWSILAEKRLGIPGPQFMMLMMDGMKPLFRAAQEGKLEPWESVVLMTTADRVVIPTEHVASVASALQKFDEEYGPDRRRQNFVFHVGAQAKVLRDYVEQAEKEGWRGVCWNQTSVSESLWDGVFDEGAEEQRPYNVDRDEEHWFWPENKADEIEAEALQETPG